LAKLSRADREAAVAQRVCPVTSDVLGAMGVCCKGCVAKVQKEPRKYLPQLKE
jgi:hypothetical protein